MWTLIASRIRNYLKPESVHKHRSQISEFLTSLSDEEFQMTQQAYRELGKVIEAEEIFRVGEESLNADA